MLKKLLSKYFIFKAFTIFISVILCIVLIFNTGFLECFAFAGIDDSLFWVLVAIMASCGITFTSITDAHIGADALWSNLRSDIQSILSSKADKINMKLKSHSILYTIGVTFLAEQWSQIVQGIISTFGDFTGVDAVLPVQEVQKLSLDNRTFSFSISCNLSSSVIYQFADSSLTVVGSKCTDYVFDSNVQSYLDNLNYRPSIVSILNISNTFYIISHINNVSSTYNSNYNISLFTFQNTNQLYDIMFNSREAVGSINYFLNQKIHFSDISTASFRILDANNQNIVQNNHLSNTSIAVNPSICPSGFWERVGWTNWLNDLIFNGSSSSALGNPGIDASAYPFNDTWHDGSINDDVDIGDSPSIGIAVPTTDDDVITLNPDKARDYTNTTVKDKDLTDTDDKTNTDNKDKTGTKPAGLPVMSLPEILFKRKFPFCLPWDLYSLFVSLNATPKAPKFTIPFKNNRLGIDYSITIDISEYETFAKLSRASLSVVFIIALILLSRKLIGAE